MLRISKAFLKCRRLITYRRVRRSTNCVFLLWFQDESGSRKYLKYLGRRVGAMLHGFEGKSIY